MAHNTSYDSDDEITTTQAKIFPHGKPIHEVLGGGKGTISFVFVIFSDIFTCFLLVTCKQLMRGLVMEKSLIILSFLS